MKKVYLIGGTMGVGKTAVSRALKHKLDRCVFLDGDWCWDMEPFVVNDETKAMVTDNICHTLNNFIGCSAYENIVFCWVMHQQEIIDDIISRLDTTGCRVIPVSLTCTEETLAKRLSADIDAGIRKPDVLERSLARLPLYNVLDTWKISTDGRNIEEIADELAAL